MNEVWFTDQDSKPLETEDKYYFNPWLKHKKQKWISIELNEAIFCNKYGWNHWGKISKSLILKYGKELPDHTKQSAIDVLETASKKSIQETPAAPSNLIGYKTANKIIKA